MEIFGAWLPMAQVSGPVPKNRNWTGLDLQPLERVTCSKSNHKYHKSSIIPKNLRFMKLGFFLGVPWCTATIGMM
jgi:hypothetical protein